MKVVKRNGEIQDFNGNKIIAALSDASEECKEPLNLSDIEILVKAVMRRLRDKHDLTIYTEEIYESIIIELAKNRFYSLLKSYNEGALRRRG